jgi:hypothetical protein
MADQTSKLTHAEAVQAYLAAPTAEEKAKIYDENPSLKAVFSVGNHPKKGK